MFSKILPFSDGRRDLMIFLDAALNSLARVDIVLGTKIMCLAYIDPILGLLGKNGTCLMLVA